MQYYLYILQLISSELQVLIITFEMMLITMRCRNAGITNEGIASLSRLTTLVSVDLSDCNSMSNPSLLALARGLPLLQDLSLHNCAHITDTGVKTQRASCHVTPAATQSFHMTMPVVLVMYSPCT